MKKIVITSDSTCDLTKELIEKNDIKIIPLYINLNNQSYRDGVDIDTSKMYQIIESTKIYPKTACPSISDFCNFFKPFLMGGSDVIYTGISSTMSGAYNNALKAAEILEEEFKEVKVYVVDSGNLSTGIALILLKACKERGKGKGAKEIVKTMENYVPKVRSQFVVPNLNFLNKGGRCNSVVKFIGNTIKLRLQIKIIDKAMNVYKKTIGAMWKGISLMVKEYMDNFDKQDNEVLFITHTEATNYKDKILQMLEPIKTKIKNIFVTTAGCVISSHCGPGTIGILYIAK